MSWNGANIDWQIVDLVNKKEKQMTENTQAFEIKETIVQTGYVDEKTGKFVPVDRAPDAYVQTGEDAEIR